MNFVISTFLFVVIIGTLITVHEFGHFFASKLSGVPVKVFAIGIGPTLFKRKYGFTTYKVNALPLGGYVSLVGEDDSSVKGGFRSKGLGAKVFILSAGVIMNFVLGAVLLGISLLITNFVVVLPVIADYNFLNTSSEVRAYPLFINSVVEDGNSDGELEEGEFIVGLDGEYFESYEEFTEILEANQNSRVVFDFLDVNEFEFYQREIDVKQRNSEDGGILEITLVRSTPVGDGLYFVEYNKNLLSPVAFSLDILGYQTVVLSSLISSGFETGDYSELAENTGSIIAVGDGISRTVEFRYYEQLFFLAGAVSLSLAFFNILPIPALDGGHIFVAIVERIIGKPIPDSILNKINLAGFSILFLLFILILVKDINQFDVVDSFFDFFRRVIGR